MKVARLEGPEITRTWNIGLSWPDPDDLWRASWIVLALMTPWFGAFVRRDGAVCVYGPDSRVYLASDDHPYVKPEFGWRDA